MEPSVWNGASWSILSNRWCLQYWRVMESKHLDSRFSAPITTCLCCSGISAKSQLSRRSTRPPENPGAKGEPEMISACGIGQIENFSLGPPVLLISCLLLHLFKVWTWSYTTHLRFSGWQSDRCLLERNSFPILPFVKTLSGRTQSHPEHCSSTATAVIGQKSPDVIQLNNTSSLSGGGGDGGKSPPTVSTSLVGNTKRKPFLPTRGRHFRWKLPLELIYIKIQDVHSFTNRYSFSKAIFDSTDYFLIIYKSYKSI